MIEPVQPPENKGEGWGNLSDLKKSCEPPAPENSTHYKYLDGAFDDREAFPNDEHLIVGYYFQWKWSSYILEVKECKEDSYCTIEIYSIGPVDNEIKIGDRIKIIRNVGEDLLYRVSVFGKYYFATFLKGKEDGYQLYHDYDKSGNDQIQEMAEVLKYARDLAIEIGKITPY